jgi:hypothetical protein
LMIIASAHVDQVFFKATSNCCVHRSVLVRFNTKVIEIMLILTVLISVRREIITEAKLLCCEFSSSIHGFVIKLLIMFTLCD